MNENFTSYGDITSIRVRERGRESERESKTRNYFFGGGLLFFFQNVFGNDYCSDVVNTLKG